jgi:hypothetical protein
MTIPESSEKKNGLWRHLPRAWFYLTPNERLAVAVIVGLLLLGLGARRLHMVRGQSGAGGRPVAESQSD